MAEAVAEIATRATADISDFESKMRRHDNQLEKSNEKAKRSSRGSFRPAFVGGILGGAAGAVTAGLVGGDSPLGSMFEVLGNVLAAALLPLVAELMPVVQKLVEFLDSPAFRAVVKFAGDTIGHQGSLPGGGLLPEAAAGAVGRAIAGPPGAVLAAGAAHLTADRLLSLESERRRAELRATGGLGPSADMAAQTGSGLIPRSTLGDAIQDWFGDRMSEAGHWFDTDVRPGLNSYFRATGGQ